MRIITVGKSDSNDIVLKHHAVSRIHLEIFIDDEDKVFVTDKNSVNGTYINGNRITFLVVLLLVLVQKLYLLMELLSLLKL